MDLPDTSSEGASVDLRANWLHLSIYFAIGHAAATVPLVYASSTLDPQVAYIGNGTLYIFMLLSALILAIPIIRSIGLKGGMAAGLALYSVYAAGFSFAAMSTTPAVQGVFWVGASICGGLAAGVLWTAQGGYLVQSSTAISREGHDTRESVNTELATQFAFYYLLFEFVAKVAWTGLMLLELSVAVTGLLFVLLAVGSTYATTRVMDLKPEESEPEKPVLEKLFATVRLWSDVRIWLLSPTNITFGVAAAYMNGSFNRDVTSKVLGSKYVGLFAAGTVLVSSAMTKLYGSLGQRFGHIVPISAGAASFACIPLLLIATSCCQDWGWSILLFYVLQGSGRSMYESTNKAIFADTFKGGDAEGAFANCVLQMSLAQAVCFFASAVVSAGQLQMSVLFFAVLTPVAYILKTHYDKNASPEAGPLLEKSA